MSGKCDTSTQRRFKPHAGLDEEARTRLVPPGAVKLPRLPLTFETATITATAVKGGKR
jgi:hypothetical protein